MTLTFALAVWFFATGMMRIAVAFHERGVAGREVTALGGVVSVVLGILIAVSWPASSGWSIKHGGPP